MPREKEIDPYRLHYRRNSLHWKTYHGDIHVVRQWLSNGGDPNLRMVNGQTLLHAATHGGWLEIVKLLIAHGADVNACSIETPYHTYPVQIAVYNGLLDILDLLVTHGADITVETEDGCTLIHLAVFGYSSEVVQYLLEREADIEIPAKSGVTPLCSATMHSYREITELLLRVGANPNAEYCGTFTPLTQNRDPDITRLLIAYGAEVNFLCSNGRTPLFEVGSIEAFEVMMEHGARLDVIDNAGNTLLHRAAEMSDNDTNGKTHEIVYHTLPESMRIAALFVAQGLDINRRNHEGLTPLAIAIAEDNEEMATFLRSHGGIE